MSSWKNVADGIWVRVYQFNNNPLHTSAVALADGGLLVVSPGTGLGDSDFADLDALGTVRALLAPGAFHNMGLPAWSARYPGAGLYGGRGVGAPFVADGAERVPTNMNTPCRLDGHARS